MPQPYLLAQTYEPVPDFDSHIAALDLDVEELCRHVGVARSTYERMFKKRTTSKKTARRIAAGYALAHGSIGPVQAFWLLFMPRERVTMEPAENQRFRRRAD